MRLYVGQGDLTRLRGNPSPCHHMKTPAANSPRLHAARRPQALVRRTQASCAGLALSTCSCWSEYAAKSESRQNLPPFGRHRSYRLQRLNGRDGHVGAGQSARRSDRSTRSPAFRGAAFLAPYTWYSCSRPAVLIFPPFCPQISLTRYGLDCVQFCTEKPIMRECNNDLGRSSRVPCATDGWNLHGSDRNMSSD